MISMIWNLLRLFRPDAALIAYFGYLVGALLGGGVVLQDAFIAAAVSLISMNFVYAFNSWADRDVDAINKPHRPIPSGELPERMARNYTLVLLALSFLYPVVLTRDLTILALFWVLPVLGVAYSAPPVRLKRNPLAAAIATSAILVTPMLLGYVMHGGSTGAAPFFGALFLFCMGAIPLKDIEDVEGDEAQGCGNWFARLGPHKLLGYASFIMLADVVVVFFAPIPFAQQLYLWAFAGGALVTVLIFWMTTLPLHKLYKTIIRVVILMGVLLFALEYAGVIA